MYPAKNEKNALQDAWTWDAFMNYAELAAKDDMTFALGMGSGLNTDATDTHGALFAACGATLIDAEGKSRLKSDAMRQVLVFARKLVKFYPADAVSHDDASNNRALISGKTALIFKPASAWAVAKRDAPAVAADCWTFPAPAGPEGRSVPPAGRSRRSPPPRQRRISPCGSTTVHPQSDACPAARRQKHSGGDRLGAGRTGRVRAAGRGAAREFPQGWIERLDRAAGSSGRIARGDVCCTAARGPVACDDIIVRRGSLSACSRGG
jgi:hypothetical protein